MSDGTTIRLSHETKRLLDAENRESESYDQTVRRLVDDSGRRMWAEDELDEYIEQKVMKFLGRESTV